MRLLRITQNPFVLSEVEGRMRKGRAGRPSTARFALRSGRTGKLEFAK